MSGADSFRLQSALAHLRSLNYAPHDFLVEFLSALDPSNARLRAAFHEHIADWLPRVLPGPRAKLDVAGLCLATLGISAVDLLLGIVKFKTDAAISGDMVHLLDGLAKLVPSTVTVWATAHSRRIYRQEMLAICAKSAGFHANASHMQPEQVQQFNLRTLSVKLQDLAPEPWNLFCLLVDERGGLRRVKAASGSRDVMLDARGDLGGEDDQIILRTPAPAQSGESSSGEAPMEVDETALPASRPEQREEDRARGAAGRNDALQEIKVLTMLGIAQQGTNHKCNAIQANMGIFLRMTRTPDVVISVLNHIGITVSNDTTDNACSSLNTACEKDIARAGQSPTSQPAYDNFNFTDPVAIPVAGRDKVFVSALSCLLICGHPCLTPAHFKFAEEMWWRNPANEVPRFAPHPSPFSHTYQILLDLPLHLDPRAQSPDFDPVDDMLETFAWHAQRILVENAAPFAVYSSHLGEPPEVLKVPRHKTEWLPMRALDLDQSTESGNIEALDNIFAQMKYPLRFADEYVTFVHVDLGGSERIHGAQSQRCDEDEAISQFKNVVDCPGLFHIRMANADSLYRLYISNSSARHTESCVWKYLRILRPSSSEQAKFTSKSGPGFRRMNDVSTHLTWALILECWVLEAKRWDASITSLEDFARKLRSMSPTAAWAIIKDISRTIAKTYIADNNFYRERRKPSGERDQVFENWRLYLQHSMLDQVASYAVKTSDVGRVVITLYDWMFIYHGVKKHKYAAHMERVLIRLAHVFPKPLAHAFLMSWIINPSGRPDGGRGADWLVELFNLYLKTMHCGSSSNFGLQHILKSSTLISLFKFVFDNFILNYHIMTHNTRHAAPDMTETIDRVRMEIAKDDALVFIPGRSSPYQCSDALKDGQAGFMTGKVGSQAAAEVVEQTETEIEDYFD